MRIKKEESIGLIIDVQSKLVPYINEYQVVISNITKLIRGLDILGIEFILTEQYPKGLGKTDETIQKVLSKFIFFEKMSFSCCYSTDFINTIRSKNKKNIIISGIESHVCVLQTVIDLIEIGFQPVVVENCISSRFINDKKIALYRMLKEGAIITTYESILFELCELSGTDVFKLISKIIK
jgi:nicotinamidase-related amidase